jgi:chemotaxis protein methyltransferase CheR
MENVNTIKIKDKEFLRFKELIYKESGIFMNEEHKELIEHKLSNRLALHHLSSFGQYYDLVLENNNELQAMINAVTTNETYFFRENKHYDFLKNVVLPTVKYDVFRSWSAAGSNGAEAYSTAMVIDSTLSTYQNWEIVTSDINSEILEFSKRGRYPMKFAKKIPMDFLKKYCLKGINEDDGFFKIQDKLKRRIKYMHINLTGTIPSELGVFDVIFLRNMIIYFDDKHKKIIVDNVLKQLKKGGYLFMGHSESLYRITDKVKQIKPSIYQKI